MAVKNVTISEENADQRVDNYLRTQCKGVPKTRIYKAIRKGEVRVNQKRVKPDYRVQVGDVVRIPPIRVAERESASPASKKLLDQIERGILVETKNYLIVDKPSGIPVHGGTGIKTGLIEGLRELRPKLKFLELAHRLDRETSGCLLVAKKRSFLLQVHALLLHKKVKKHYLALVQGDFAKQTVTVTAPLKKNHLAGGERIVVVSTEGKNAQTLFRPLVHYGRATLVEAIPVTGRTHQIRVHAAHLGHPIAQDEKYGDRAFNRWAKSMGIDRLFLHSASLSFRLPDPGNEVVGVCAPLSPNLQAALLQLQRD